MQNIMDLEFFKHINECNDLDHLKKVLKYLHIIIKSNKTFFLKNFKKDNVLNFTEERYLETKEKFFMVQIQCRIETLEILQDKLQREKDKKYNEKNDL
jgi:hypothetical protein